MRSLLLLFVLAFPAVASGQAQVWWEGHYGGRYYPGRYYSLDRLCCNKANCQMRAAIIASIHDKERQQRASVTVPASPAIDATDRYQTITRYRAETRTKMVQRCNGKQCWLEQVSYTVQVPYQVQVPIAAPQGLAKPRVQVDPAHNPLSDTRLDPSPHEAVREMLSIVKPLPSETLMDIGCGDGRILIAAALEYGVTAHGIDLNATSVELARARVEAAGVTGLVSVTQGDALALGSIDADIVTMYLYPELIEALWPKIKPGTVVISLEHQVPSVSATKVERGEFTFYVCVKRNR